MMTTIDYWVAVITGRYYAQSRFWLLLNGNKPRQFSSIKGLMARLVSRLFISADTDCDTGPGSEDWAIDYEYPDEE